MLRAQKTPRLEVLWLVLGSEVQGCITRCFQRRRLLVSEFGLFDLLVRGLGCGFWGFAIVCSGSVSCWKHEYKLHMVSRQEQT